MLPEDARFCHKCGKPQYEEDIARLAPEPVTATPASVHSSPQGSRVSFKNGRAVAISVIMAVTALACSQLAALISPVLVPIVFLAAGFFAARIYRRQSAAPLSGSAGAFLGWMTGLWVFLVSAIALLGSSAGRDVIKQIENMPQMAAFSGSPREIAVSILLTGLCISTLLPVLGGILGATLSTKGQRSS